jgi:hypothetical protein
MPNAKGSNDERGGVGWVMNREAYTPPYRTKTE